MSQLTIVATPIGNLADLSVRAIEALTKCDIVLCEDTRVCTKLLQHIGISKKMICYRDDNEIQQAYKIIDMIEAGQTVCLTSDAGTPGISDPGFRIVRACRQKNIPITTIPGPSALVTVVCASGLPTNGFLFLGFPPNKSAGRIKLLQKFSDFEYSIVFYESCHRIVRFINDIIAVMGPSRNICVAKEVTKLHEQFFVGEAGTVIDSLQNTSVKGEFTVVVAPGNFNLGN